MVLNEIVFVRVWLRMNKVTNDGSPQKVGNFSTHLRDYRILKKGPDACS